MAWDAVPLIERTEKAAESAEQDQNARTCSLILLYTFRKIEPIFAIGMMRVKVIGKVFLGWNF